jgi:hypothetical protein
MQGCREGDADDLGFEICDWGCFALDHARCGGCDGYFNQELKNSGRQ